MNQPLSEKLRPETLDTFFGQSHLVGSNGLLRKLIESKRCVSILLWGPPGCGKTTLAKIYAKAFSRTFRSLSATDGTLAEFKKWMKDREKNPLFSQAPILFIDEIHRFNKAQQDAFLPQMEKGELILIGATTENPSFALNHALLSRFRVFTLNSLQQEELESIIDRYAAWANHETFSPDIKELITKSSAGDARHLINILEHLHLLEKDHSIKKDEFEELLLESPAQYDRGGEGHYNLISALHKSVRGSDPDASLYWLYRMLVGGEDPKFISRRLIRMAMEDIGIADPTALSYVVSLCDAYQRLGSPEGEIAFATAVIYLALAPKSNSVYFAEKKAYAEAKESSHLPPPKHILNAPTAFMKQEGYGEGYIYDHDTEAGCSGQTYFPDQVDPMSFYQPGKRGFEENLSKRLEYFKKLRSLSSNLP